MRRWSLRIIIAVAVLLIVVIAVTQIVLSFTTIPDRIVLSQVQQQLGLRMTAASVDTGWFGTTVIKDVTLSLPLAEESLLATPELRVRHTWLPKLLLTRKLTLDRLELADAQLVVRQAPSGRWNLQDLVELLARTGGKQQAAQTSTKRAGPKLPGVLLHNGTVTVTDKAGRAAQLAPLEFSGLPDGPLVWRYDATVGATLKAVGQMSPGFEWAHQVDFDVNDAGGLLKPWVGELAEPLNVAGRWEGEIQGGVALGRLDLQKLQAMGLDVGGVVRARAGGGAARVEPQKLTIKTTQKMLPELQVTSGLLELEGTTVRATRLKVSALTGVAQVDGRWAMEQDAGELTASWDEIAQPGGVRHSGRLTAAVTNTLGQPAVNADLVSSGAARGGRWRTQMKLTGGGRDWDQMDWKVTAPALSWVGPPRDVMLDGLVATLATRGKVLELTSVQLPSAERIAGKGSIDFASQAWSLNLTGRGWPVPRLPESTLEFRLAGAGDFKLYKLSELFLRTGDVELSGKGFYDRAIPKPLDLDLVLRHTPVTTEADPTLQGALRAEAHVNGTARPLQVALSGNVLGQAIRVKGRAIGDVAIEVKGAITATEAKLESKELALLEGRWSLDGSWLKETNVARLNVRVRDLPLEQCGEAIARRSDVAGMLDGAWTFELPNFNRARLTATGGFAARDVRVGEFPVETATGKMTMRDGRIEVGPVDLVQGEGKATANVSVAAATPMRPTVGLTASKWPVNLPAAGASLLVSTDAKLDVNLETRSVAGPLTAAADVTLGSDHLGRANVAADFNGRAVRLRSLEADAFAGKVTGNGNFDLDKLLATTGELKWQDIDAAAVAAIFPRVTGVVGRFGGRATLGPANDPRALEPLRLDVVLDSYGANYRGATIGDGSLTAFMNYETGGKPGVGDRFRIVMSDTQEDPSLIRFADGIVRIWARFGRHRGVREPAGQVTIDLDRLDIDQLVHVGAPDADPMPGRLSGTINVYGTPTDVTRTSGIGSLRVTDSDLANFDVFAFLYEQMNVLSWGKDKPQFRGHGSVDLRFEADTLYINNVRYFNRGTEIRATALVRDVWRLPESPVEATAVGSVRPFSSLELPLLADVDDVLNVIQQGVTPARVSGTVRHPRVELVPFEEIGAGMRSLLLGDVQAETRGR